MSPRIALVVMLAKMALENGDIDGREGKLLAKICGRVGLEPDKAIEQARATRLEAVLENVTAAADRVVVAFHAFLMANVDGEFDSWERELYDLVLTILEISPADQTSCEAWARLVLAGQGPPPELATIVASSSFNGM